MHLRRSPTLLGSLLCLAASGLGCDPPSPPEVTFPDFPGFRPEAVRSALIPTAIRHDPNLAPISGGTLLVTSDGVAVASDPDHDRIYTVRLPRENVGTGAPFVHALAPHSEPGRAVEGPAGTAFVVLRRAGEVIALDTAAGTVSARFSVCPAPRGVAFDRAQGLVRVACAGGEIVSFNPAVSDAPMRTVKTDDDLRDIVMLREGFAVTRFRSAEVLEFNSDVTLRRRISLRTANRETLRPQGVGVAWRAVATPDGGLAVIHQRMLTLADIQGNAPVPQGMLHYGASQPNPTAESNSCKPGLVQSVVTMIPPGGPAIDFPPLVMAPLPVDMAWLNEGAYVAVAGLGLEEGGGIRRVNPADLNSGHECAGARVPMQAEHGEEQLIAVAPSADGLVSLSRAPMVLHTPYGAITLDPSPTSDTGHAVFHAATTGGMACASCHPEGGDDGHVWRFTGNLPRRTQSLHGGVAGTFPLHWEGDMQDFGHLMDEVFVRRMGGAPLPEQHATALEGWVNTVPMPVSNLVSTDAETTDAVARGRAVFNRPDVGCAACHTGSRFTNNATMDVGTGEALQVPSLTGLRWRAPYMHNGCAASLRDRFANPACGGGDRHGVTSQLSPAEINDLIAYLQSI